MIIMLKKRIVTISITLALFGAGLVLEELHLMDVIEYSPVVAVTMMQATAIFVFGGCILQTFGKRTLARWLAFASFFVLCVCLLYSVHIIEYASFVLCMTLLLYRSIRICDVECTL